MRLRNLLSEGAALRSWTGTRQACREAREAAAKKQSKEPSSKAKPGDTVPQGKLSGSGGQRASDATPASGPRLRTSLVTSVARRVTYGRTVQTGRVRQRSLALTVRRSDPNRKTNNSRPSLLPRAAEGSNQQSLWYQIERRIRRAIPHDGMSSGEAWYAVQA